MPRHFVAACFDERVGHDLYLAAVTRRDQVSYATALQERVRLSVYIYTHTSTHTVTCMLVQTAEQNQAIFRHSNRAM